MYPRRGKKRENYLVVIFRTVTVQLGWDLCSDTDSNGNNFDYVGISVFRYHHESILYRANDMLVQVKKWCVTSQPL